jgi:hypothetical protein
MTYRKLLRKLGVILGMLCLLVPLTGGTASATTAYYSVLSLPWSANMNVCIGGQICGKSDTVTLDLPPSSYISYVHVYAHDNVGSNHGAHLNLYLDGVKMGELDVKSSGSTLVFPLYTVGSRIVFLSTQADGSSAGDETVIQQIDVFNS